MHNKDLGLLLIRVTAGIVFMVHGYQKLSDLQGTVGFFDGLGMAAFFAYVVAVVEFLGGISFIIGYGSKIAGVLLAIVMLVAFFVVHLPNGFSVSAGGYEFVLALFGAALGIAFAGPGRYGFGPDCGCFKNDMHAGPSQM